ncbi:hypothetical protein [Streptomyces sp. NRRL B-24484]|uniref:hypothetical protein n=1 Tax=Streptomyces sp. NRRL B-24484 TaxID=1463833 RepID=UPI000693E92B|nr:hypothetical protein [Streptomyces sp. NRRL B-24484]
MRTPIAPLPLSTPRCAACGEPAAVQWRRRNVEDPNATDAVYACGPHAITLDAAALVHQADCPAPDPAVLPECGCSPEPAPPPTPVPGAEPTTALPTGWVVPTGT